MDADSISSSTRLLEAFERMGASQGEGLVSVHAANFTHFWNACKQLLGRERGRKSLRGLLGGDRASRCDHQYLLFHNFTAAIR